MGVEIEKKDLRKKNHKLLTVTFIRSLSLINVNNYFEPEDMMILYLDIVPAVTHYVIKKKIQKNHCYIKKNLLFLLVYLLVTYFKHVKVNNTKNV
jgi:hypothetical protein